MTKPILPFVETMITQVCNLSCDGCTNYSDLQHSGYIRWEQGKEWLQQWLTRVDIPDFGIIGGEPTVSPDVSKWIYGIRELLPHAQIRFTTNGLLLKKKFELVHQLAEVGNCVFKIAVHQENHELEETIQEIFDMYNWEPVVEFGVHRYKTKNNFRFHVKRPDIFWKTFQGSYQNMYPHTNNPLDAFKICCQQTCPLLHNGTIYKCSTSGLLKETLIQVGNPNYDLWKDYIQTGITPTCSEYELHQFLDGFGKPEQVCSMCPTEIDLQSRIVHINHVSTKKIK